MPRSCANSTWRHGHSSPTASSFRRPSPRSHGRTPDTLLVGTDFGPDSMTESGYPRVVKRWRRGRPLSRGGTTLFSGPVTDVIVSASVDRTPDTAHAGASRGRLLQRSGLRVTRRRTGADRRTHRRVAVGAPGVAADRAPHRLVHRLGAVPRRLAAGRRLREIPRRHSGSHRRLRARRAHLPASVRLDAGQVADGHARRRREQGRGRHPGDWTRSRCRTCRGAPTAPSSPRPTTPATKSSSTQRLPDPVATAARRRGWDAHRDQAGAVLLRRRGSGGGQHFATSDDGTAVPYFVVRHRHDRSPGKPCWAATAASRCPGHRATTGC